MKVRLDLKNKLGNSPRRKKGKDRERQDTFKIGNYHRQMLKCQNPDNKNHQRKIYIYINGEEKIIIEESN